MTENEIEYRNHRLAVIEQPGGGSMVEITPLAGGQTLRTKTYQTSREAIAEANSMVDRYSDDTLSSSRSVE
jgi:hypothetical protein